MKRVLWSLVAFILPLALFWLGGGEFVRGDSLAGITILSIFCAGWVGFHPLWDGKGVR